MARRKWSPGSRCGGFILIGRSKTDSSWVASCACLRRTSRIHPSTALKGRPGCCVLCLADRRRQPRRCATCPRRGWDGCKATECPACERRRLRNGVCPSCASPLFGGRTGYRRPVCQCGWRGLSANGRRVAHAVAALEGAGVYPTWALLREIAPVGARGLNSAVKLLGVVPFTEHEMRVPTRDRTHERNVQSRRDARVRARRAIEALHAAHVLPTVELVMATADVPRSRAWYAMLNSPLASVYSHSSRRKRWERQSAMPAPKPRGRPPLSPLLVGPHGEIYARRKTWRPDRERYEPLARRWLAGESTHALAAETGMSHHTLRCAFCLLGFKKTGPRKVSS